MLHPLQTAELTRQRRAALQAAASHRRPASPVPGKSGVAVRIGRLATTAEILRRSTHARVARALLGTASSRGR